MDLTSTIIGVGLLLLCVLPFVFMGRKRRKNENLLKQKLHSLAADKQCKLANCEVHGNFAMAMDESGNYLFYSNSKRQQDVNCSINLTEIQSCKVVNTSRTLEDSGDKRTIIDKLELSFAPIEKSKPAILLEFYEVSEDLQLNGELQAIQMWEDQINSRLKNR